MLSYLGDTFRLQYAENSGGFLSLGAALPEWARFVVFILVSGAGLVALGWLGVRGARDGARNLAGLTLVIAGGASNLYDRIVWDGVVIDFLNVGVNGLRTGVFNVADMAILAGTGWLLTLHITSRRRTAGETAVPESEEPKEENG